MSTARRKRHPIKKIISPFRNKNRRIAIYSAILWLVIVLGADALIIHAVHTKLLSYGMVSWWRILRLILVAWTIMIYKFVRTFDKAKTESSEKPTEAETSTETEGKEE